MVDPHDDPIELTESQHRAWQNRFSEEDDRIRDTLSAHNLSEHVERIEHVGSTAVPDLAAKDIVDINIIVSDSEVGTISEVLETELGGTRLENTDSWHPIFRTQDGQRYNDHIFGVSGDKWKTSVATRDVLRERPDLRKEYEQLKQELTHEHDGLIEYSESKTEFIEQVLRAGQKDDNMDFGFTVPIED